LASVFHSSIKKYGLLGNASTFDLSVVSGFIGTFGDKYGDVYKSGECE